MQLPTRHPVVVTLVGIVALFQWGCALKRLGSPSLEEVRGQVRVVGVGSPSDARQTKLRTPTSGKGAGAAKGAAAGALVGAQPGAVILGGMGRCSGGGQLGAVICGTVVLFGLGVTAAGGTLGALGGALHGAVNTAAPSKEVGEALKSTVAQLSVHEALRESVLQTGIRQTQLTFVPLPTGPTLKSTDANRRYAGLGTDTVLEVALHKLELRLEHSRANPPVTLVASARARLIRAADGRELHRHAVTHKSATRPYDEWAENDGHHLREALATASANVAEEIIDVLFLRSDPPKPTPAPASPRPLETVTPAPQYQWKASGSRERAMKETACRNQHLAFRSDWRDRLPEYRACLAQ